MGHSNQNPSMKEPNNQRTDTENRHFKHIQILQSFISYAGLVLIENIAWHSLHGYISFRSQLCQLIWAKHEHLPLPCWIFSLNFQCIKMSSNPEWYLYPHSCIRPPWQHTFCSSRKLTHTCHLHDHFPLSFSLGNECKKVFAKIYKLPICSCNLVA